MQRDIDISDLEYSIFVAEVAVLLPCSQRDERMLKNAQEWIPSCAEIKPTVTFFSETLFSNFFWIVWLLSCCGHLVWLP
jgi:hypothetical protein